MHAASLALAVIFLSWFSPSHASFLASAVQFRSGGGLPKWSPAETLTLNAERMAALVDEIAHQGSSFIAFPEFSLLPPNSALHPSPFSLCHTNITSFAEYCEELPAIARKISNCSAAARAPLDIMSCASARNPSATISYNTCEAVGNGHLYNTQVVLRDGVVLTSYRKLHPFFTDCFNIPPLQLRYFEVNRSTVGLFTCKDILYHDPKASLLAVGIRIFSYSSAIELVAHELVQGFARAHNVTVISSDRASAQTQIVAGMSAPVDCREIGSLGCVATAWVDQ